MSDSNDPYPITSYELIELIRPVILAYTKHEQYTDQILQLIDDATRMRAGYDVLSPAGKLFFTAICLLDPVDPLIVEAMTGIMLDKLRITEPPADLPEREGWLLYRNELLKGQAEAIALDLMVDVEVHIMTEDDLAVDWSQLADLDDLGGSNG